VVPILTYMKADSRREKDGREKVLWRLGMEIGFTGGSRNRPC